MFAFAMVCCVSSVLADEIFYGGRHEVVAEGGALRAFHRHDWDAAKRAAFTEEPAQAKRFFSADNDFAYVELREIGGRLLFRKPSPALTYLWISPDAQFLIGLSALKYRNPWQLVVWRRDGTLVHRERIGYGHAYSDDFTESITNSVLWFDHERPEPSVVQRDGRWMLLLRSPKGKPMTIPLGR